MYIKCLIVNILHEIGLQDSKRKTFELLKMIFSFQKYNSYKLFYLFFMSIYFLTWF